MIKTDEPHIRIHFIVDNVRYGLQYFLDKSLYIFLFKQSARKRMNR